MKCFQNIIFGAGVLTAVLGCNLFSPGWRASEACQYLEETGLKTVAYTQKENRAYTCFEKGLIKNNERVTSRPDDNHYQAKPDEASINYYAWGGFNSSIANSLELSMHTGESKAASEFQKDFLRLNEILYQKAIGSPLPENAKDYILSPANSNNNLLELKPQNSKVKNARVEITKNRYGTNSHVLSMKMKIYIPEQ